MIKFLKWMLLGKPAEAVQPIAARTQPQAVQVLECLSLVTRERLRTAKAMLDGSVWLPVKPEWDADPARDMLLSHDLAKWQGVYVMQLTPLGLQVRNLIKTGQVK